MLPLPLEPCLRIVRSRSNENRSETMRTHLLIVGFAAAITLAGCGTNPGDRAVSGALIGAAGGAAIGAAAGNPALGAIRPGIMTAVPMSIAAAAPIATANRKG